jgi:hypothetical protein
LSARTPTVSLITFALFQAKESPLPRCSSLGRAQAGAAEDNGPHDETQNCSTATNLNIVGVGTQAKQLQRPSPFRAKVRRSKPSILLDDQ